MPATPSQMDRRRILPVAGQLIFVAFVSAMAFFTCRKWGLANECTPASHDGQCGLASAMGVMFGVLAALAVFIAGGIVVLIREIHEKKRRAPRTETGSITPSAEDID